MWSRRTAASIAKSALVGRGREVVTYAAEGVRVGCSICYDLRFGELYRRLAAEGAQMLMVPAAFTLQTGKDHWEILLRARAIETQCFVPRQPRSAASRPAATCATIGVTA